jgi:hypothetical protein
VPLATRVTAPRTPWLAGRAAWCEPGLIVACAPRTPPVPAGEAAGEAGAAAAAGALPEAGAETAAGAAVFDAGGVLCGAFVAGVDGDAGADGDDELHAGDSDSVVFSLFAMDASPVPTSFDFVFVLDFSLVFVEATPDSFTFVFDFRLVFVLVFVETSGTAGVNVDVTDVVASLPPTHADEACVELVGAQLVAMLSPFDFVLDFELVFCETTTPFTVFVSLFVLCFELVGIAPVTHAELTDSDVDFDEDLNELFDVDPSVHESSSSFVFELDFSLVFCETTTPLTDFVSDSISLFELVAGAAGHEELTGARAAGQPPAGAGMMSPFAVVCPFFSAALSTVITTYGFVAEPVA